VLTRRSGAAPPVRQLAGYNRQLFASDLSAGLTVGVMLVPQGMAYALIAGMPAIYGLYASLTPLVVYALLGSSRQLAVGPVAMVSLLTAAGVAPLAGGDPQRYIELALLLALLVGVLQTTLGLLRFGFVTNLLSHPVLAGFTSAAALIIGASQLKHLAGVELPGTNRVYEILAGLGGQLHALHLPTVAAGALAILLLASLKRWRATFPGALAVVALFTSAVAFIGPERLGLSTVGSVPRGLPLPVLPALDASALAGLLPVALAIALVGFMESIAVAKVYAARHRYRVAPNQELIALGAANLAGALFQAFPTTGGFSRTAVNDQAGARTTVATLVAAGIIALTLVFLTGLFHTLPNAVLAALVVSAVAGLFQWREFVRLWQVDRRDFGIMTTTFAATLGIGIEQGILVGVLVSLGALVYASSRPHAAVLGRLPGTNTFRNLERHPHAERLAGVTIYRIDATLSFANAEFLRDQLRMLVEADPPPTALVLDFHAVNGVDSTALHEVEELLDHLRRLDIAVSFAGVKGPVMDRFARAGLVARIGSGRFHHEVRDAVAGAQARLAPAAPARSNGRTATGAGAPGGMNS
jgi:sulfate permease, SulP family